MSGKPGSQKKRSKGKRNKGRAGGSRRFVHSATELEHRDRVEEEKQRRRRERRGSDDEDGSDDEFEKGPLNTVEEGGADDSSEYDDSDDEEDGEPKKEAKPAGALAGLIQTSNPNDAKPQNKTMKAKDVTAKKEVTLSRREKEELEKQKGPSEEEVRKDLERLAMVKKRREDAARRKREEEEAAREKAELEQQQDAESSEDEFTSIDVKKMKPPELKAKLKKRGLSVQGNKKDLQQRLLEAIEG